MAWRLGDHVVRGELFNHKNYCVHGWIELRGREPLAFELTGNCNADLAGWHICFENQTDPKTLEPDPDPADLSSLASHQIGPTGVMTAARKVRVFDCAPAEFIRRSELGEPPPTRWVRCLFLEWFSQNGRVVVELPDPKIEFKQFQRIQHFSTIAPYAETGPEDEESSAGGFSATSIRVNDQGEVEIRDETPPESDPGTDDLEDPDGLLSEALQQCLDAQAWVIDQAVGGGESEDRVLRETEMMDRLMEKDDGELIGALFNEPTRLPRPDELSEERAEHVLKALLAHLAIYGVGLHVCEHFSPRDAYRLLVEDICWEQKVFRELRHTQWVQMHMTSEHCPQCQAEEERKFKEKPPTSGNDSDPTD